MGAGLTHLGCALFSRGLRQPMRIAVTCGVGALFGLLFFFGQRKFIDERLLFVVWQPVVAFCIGMALAEGVEKPDATAAIALHGHLDSAVSA